jgi:hypothetical protein
MGRQRQPDGRRVTVSTKLSDAETAALDAARGLVTRGAWLRGAAMAAAEQQTPPGPPARPLHAADNGTDREADSGQSGGASHRCPVKGWCADCQEWKGGPPG